MITKTDKAIFMTLEGIEGGKKFNPLEFPPNKLNLTNGTQLTPAQDMPWFGLKKGQKFGIAWNGKYVMAGGLSWSVDQLVGEIEQGFWKVV